MWFQANEGAKFWMQVLTDLKQRGVQDILIACVDGLKGFPEAIEALFPRTTVQTCIVHLIRHSLRYVPRRQYDAVVKDLKPIYTAIDADQALLALETFDEKWGEQLPVIGQAWREAGEHVIPFMAYEPEVRRVIYTTNAIEALNRQLRKALKTKGSFPRRRRPEVDLPRNPERRAPVDPDARVDESVTRVQDAIRRPTAQLAINHRLHRKADALVNAGRSWFVLCTARGLLVPRSRNSRAFGQRWLLRSHIRSRGTARAEFATMGNRRMENFERTVWPRSPAASLGVASRR